METGVSGTDRVSRLRREVLLRVLLAGVLLIGLVGCSAGQPDTAETASSRVANIGPAIDAAHAEEVSGLHELRAVLVSVDGEVVAERYYDSDPTDYADLQSVTKSIMSTLVGIACPAASALPRSRGVGGGRRLVLHSHRLHVAVVLQ